MPDHERAAESGRPPSPPGRRDSRGRSDRTLRELQRTAGNKAVARLIGAHPRAALLLRDTFTPHEDPLLRDAEAFNSCWQNLPRTARVFFDEWLLYAQLGAQRVEEPQLDEAGGGAWWAGLAANVAWGLTAIDPVLWPVAIAAAATASVTAQPSSSESAPSINPIVGDALARARDAMEKEVRRTHVRQVSLTCGQQGIRDSDQQDRLLWSSLFPAVPYDSRAQTIADMAETNVRAVRDEIMREYRAWLDSLQSVTGGKTNEFIRARYPFRPKLTTLERLVGTGRSRPRPVE
jgi:hypothetical protein